MVLYDDILPPLDDNTYRITVETDVGVDGNPQDLPPKQSYFSIEGPRFQLSATEVAGVFPPRNGHGSFSESVPHVILSRRTMPWERVLDPAHKIPAPTVQPGDAPAPASQPPWLALLIFEEGENFQIIQNVPLEQIVGPAIYADLGSPPNVSCDALQTEVGTLSSILPSLEEMTLLTHVRQINVNDRELNIGSTDGFFSVIMSNRIPSPNSKCTACLVSLEARSDVVLPDPPAPQARPAFQFGGGHQIELIGGTLTTISLPSPIIYFLQSVQLVLLHSWKFECIGPGSFFDLMQALNVAMIGTVKNPGHPPLTDTCHLPMELQDRAGVAEPVFYRSPCVPFQLTRDTLGPYHSSDQCVRATPETGAKDISYAAAFEVGRLIAAADKSLASALMQWRRDAYTQSSRADTVGRAQTALNLGVLDLHTPVMPFLAAGATTLVAQGAGPISDPFGLDKVRTVIGLNPTAVQQAFGLDTPQQAAGMLGGDPGATGGNVLPVQQTTRNATILDEVAADSAGLLRLTQTRKQRLSNITVQLGVPVVTGISPTKGPIQGSTSVTITGSRFTGTTAVNFGRAAAVQMAVLSDTQIQATSPSEDAAGQAVVDVTVISSAGVSATSAADQFTYLPTPVISGITPNSGPETGGTNVTINGSGFTDVTAVNFGAIAATSFGFVSDTQVTATSPAHTITPGTPNGVDITISTPGGQSAAGTPDAFTYLLPPSILEIEPRVGPSSGNFQVILIGGAFTSATAVNFGPAPATSFKVESDREIIALAPPGQGTVDITVTTPGGTSVKGQSDQLTYVAPPSVTSVNPNFLNPGQSTTISGSGFAGANIVKFGTVPATSFTVVSDSQITAVIPQGTGRVDVTVTSPGGTSAINPADQFVYVTMM
jgi:hypothetical protein